MLQERFIPDPGPLGPILCDGLVKKIAAGEAVAFNGRKVAEHKDSLKRFGVPIEGLLEYVLVIRKAERISSETLQKLRDFGEEAAEEKQRFCCLRAKVFSKENPRLERLLVELDDRIMQTKEREMKKYTKKTGHLPPIPEEQAI